MFYGCVTNALQTFFSVSPCVFRCFMNLWCLGWVQTEMFYKCFLMFYGLFFNVLRMCHEFAANLFNVSPCVFRCFMHLWCLRRVKTEMFYGCVTNCAAHVAKSVFVWSTGVGFVRWWPGQVQSSELMAQSFEPRGERGYFSLWFPGTPSPRGRGFLSLGSELRAQGSL